VKREGPEVFFQNSVGEIEKLSTYCDPSVLVKAFDSSMAFSSSIVRVENPEPLKDFPILQFQLLQLHVSMQSGNKRVQDMLAVLENQKEKFEKSAWNENQSQGKSKLEKMRYSQVEKLSHLQYHKIGEDPPKEYAQQWHGEQVETLLTQAVELQSQVLEISSRNPTKCVV